MACNVFESYNCINISTFWSRRVASRELTPVLLREFASPCSRMRRVLLQVVQQCVATEGVQPGFVRTQVLPEFVRQFWVPLVTTDRCEYKQLVATTSEIAKKVGVPEFVESVGAVGPDLPRILFRAIF